MTGKKLPRICLVYFHQVRKGFFKVFRPPMFLSRERTNVTRSRRRSGLKITGNNIFFIFLHQNLELIGRYSDKYYRISIIEEVRQPFANTLGLLESCLSFFAKLFVPGENYRSVECNFQLTAISMLRFFFKMQTQKLLMSVSSPISDLLR